MNARRLLPIALLLGASLTSYAQTRPATVPQAAPAKQAPARAAPSVDPNAIVQAAVTVAQLIDQGQVAQVWKGASPVAHAAATEKQFVDGLTAKRNALGNSAERSGTAALTPAPVPRDWKTWLLWGLLIAGAALVAGFAISLLRKPAQ